MRPVSSAAALGNPPSSGYDDLVEYGDLRVLLGAKAVSPSGRSRHAKLGIDSPL
jgi:hypothetical protein